MTNNIWEMLEEYFDDDLDEYGIECTQDDILDAQKKLGLQFSEGYLKFLRTYGSAVLPGHIIYGLSYLSDMGRSIKNVIEKTNFYKNTQKWPGIDDWYVISDDGSGNPIGMNPKGEVWLSDHDSNFEQIKLADNFEEFLYKLLTDTLYE
jgi:hypothetical protein